MKIVRDFVETLHARLLHNPPLIEVVIGPRQVGKTTGVKQLLQKTALKHHYISADGDISKPSSWIIEQWYQAKNISSDAVLVIDEIQKVENWAEVIKKLWDQQNFDEPFIRVILLGSSSLELQHGLSESLAGRYFLHSVHHWSAQESRVAFNIGLDEYLKFGGYPGSYAFIDNKIAWLNYLQNSIIEAVIGKDILSISRVKSPALFKQCFFLACSYACQEISYTKLLGQLQDKGNVEIVKHYLELFEKAFLLKQLFKFSNKKTLSRSSSPKILPLCPALYSVTIDADYGPENTGRAFELTVGSLLNQLPGQLYYWRSKNLEVDYVYQFGKKIWAIEVKSNFNKSFKSLEAFQKEFPNSTLVLINPENFEQEIEKIALA